MNTNRTKILSIMALIALLFIQIFWMWNTYNINAQQLGKECDNVLGQTLDKECNQRFHKYFHKGDVIEAKDTYHPELWFYEALYKKSHKDANIDSLSIIADSILKAKKIPFRSVIHKVNMRNGKIIEGTTHYNNFIPFLVEIKTSVVPVRTDKSVGYQLTIKDGDLYIISKNWIFILTSLLTTMVIVLSIIDQINYIDEQERIKLLREDFSYAMVHDMKSPLTSIIMGTRYLHSGVLEKKPEMKEKYFMIVEDEAQHLLALINRLLTISKLEHGKLTIRKTEVDLESIINDIVDKYEAKSSKPIIIKTNIACPTALADEEYLKEAINNMVDNATKYSKDKINIKISTLEDDKHVYIKAYDEGIGIAKSEQKTIFNRYERAAEHEKNPQKTRGGFGIGLNYVLQVIHAHGGKISVKSEKGKYSEFTIALPK